MTIEADTEDRVADAPDAEEAVELSEVEQLAAELGWKPRAAWKTKPGEEDTWTDAATFIRHTKAKADATRKELIDTKKTVDEVVVKRVEAMERTMRKARERELAGVRAEYTTLIRQAVAKGDDRAEDALRAELEGIENEYKELEEVQLTPEQLKKAEDEFVDNFQVGYPKVQKPFWEEHAWILDDEADIEDFGLVEAEITRMMQNGRSLPEALEAADKLIRKTFADRYEAEAEPVAKRAEKDGPRVPVLASARRGAAKSLASRLPPEARAQAKKEIERGLFGSYEEWAEVYQESGGELL
jgi:hypothetical protein